ncbi:hypothetical protein PHMEG_00011976 [Phytophthora megakarya]|uniref:Uncharacterized protein n=1 Tax=Phytophthora megakarya TaxID=4795 RepID=A0A225W9W8_9STRA|nr:hypothetical protein PHMEG_00011976 [Phytophthora megakarya]
MANLFEDTDMYPWTYGARGEGTQTHQKVRGRRCKARVNLGVTAGVSGKWYLRANTSASYAENRVATDPNLTKNLSVLHKACANVHGIIHYLRTRTGMDFSNFCRIWFKTILRDAHSLMQRHKSLEEAGLNDVQRAFAVLDKICRANDGNSAEVLVDADSDTARIAVFQTTTRTIFSLKTNGGYSRSTKCGSARNQFAIVLRTTKWIEVIEWNIADNENPIEYIRYIESLNLSQNRVPGDFLLGHQLFDFRENLWLHTTSVLISMMDLRNAYPEVGIVHPSYHEFALPQQRQRIARGFSAIDARYKQVIVNIRSNHWWLLRFTKKIACA